MTCCSSLIFFCFFGTISIVLSVILRNVPVIFPPDFNVISSVLPICLGNCHNSVSGRSAPGESTSIANNSAKKPSVAARTSSAALTLRQSSCVIPVSESIITSSFNRFAEAPCAFVSKSQTPQPRQAAAIASTVVSGNSAFTVYDACRQTIKNGLLRSPLIINCKYREFSPPIQRILQIFFALAENSNSADTNKTFIKEKQLLSFSGKKFKTV